MKGKEELLAVFEPAASGGVGVRHTDATKAFLDRGDHAEGLQVRKTRFTAGKCSRSLILLVLLSWYYLICKTGLSESTKNSLDF